MLHVYASASFIAYSVRLMLDRNLASLNKELYLQQSVKPIWNIKKVRLTADLQVLSHSLLLQGFVISRLSCTSLWHGDEQIT